MLQERSRDITPFAECPVYSNFKVDRIKNRISWVLLFILSILKIHFNLSISAQSPRKNVTYSWNSGCFAKKAVISRPLSVRDTLCIFKTYSILVLVIYFDLLLFNQNACMKVSFFSEFLGAFQKKQWYYIIRGAPCI